MIGIQNEHCTSLALQQLPRFCHYLRHEALEIALLLEYTPSQGQQYLIPLIFEYRRFEKLRILNTDAAKSKITAEDFNVTGGEFLGS